jgi:signal transduction histidine kinase
VSGDTHIEDFIHPADRAMFENAAEQRAAGETEPLQYQYRIRRQDGRWHWMHERQIAIVGRNKASTEYETLALDFSDRVRFERQQQRMEHLQRLLSGVLESVVDSDDAMTDLANTLDRVVQYLGLSSATLLAVDDAIQEVEPIVSAVRDASVSGPGVPLNGEAAAWWLRRIIGGVPMTIERKNLTEIEPRLRNDFAKAITGSVLVTPLLLDSLLKFVFVLEAPETDRSWEPEETSVLQAIAHAVSRRLERDEAERDRASFETIRSNIERTEAIAHFVSGIIHDFNNLMFAVSGRLALLIRKTDDDKTREGLEEVQAAATDAGHVLRRLLQAERLGLDDALDFDPWNEMAQIIRTAQRLLPKRIRFEADVRPPQAGSHRLMRAVPQTLQQLVLNLVVNSRDAVESNGRIRIAAGPTSDEQMFYIQVEDDGPGIPESMREEVVKAFVSTKESGSGTGLGLSICTRVVRDAGGTLELGESSLGGLCVTAQFPLVEGSPQVPNEPATLEYRLDCIVLVIEDNMTIREVLCRELESAGATVLALPDAINAEHTIATATQPIGLYVFDIDLPHRTGIECLEDLRRNGNQTPCVFITGGMAEPPNLGHTALLRKPFRTSTLLDTCVELLSDA